MGLEHHIRSYFKIQCAKCNTSEKVEDEDRETAAFNFEDDGWKLIDDKPYCSMCVERVEHDATCT